MSPTRTAPKMGLRKIGVRINFYGERALEKGLPQFAKSFLSRLHLNLKGFLFTADSGARSLPLFNLSSIFTTLLRHLSHCYQIHLSNLIEHTHHYKLYLNI